MRLFSKSKNPKHLEQEYCKVPERWGHHNPMRYITSFSKAITGIWLALFIEVILFSQLATILSWGDALSIQYVNDTVKEIGVIICGAYFSSKCFENIAQGYEEWKEKMFDKTKDTSGCFEGPEEDCSDDDTIPL